MKDAGAIKGILLTTIRMLPPIARGAVKTVGTGGVGTVAAAQDWMQQGAGSIYEGLIEEGVEDKSQAKTAALLGGLFYGAIGSAQMKQYANIPTKFAKNTLVNAIKRVGIEKAKDVTKEVIA